MDDDFSELVSEVPGPYVDRFIELAELTDTFCDAHLDAQYKQFCREMAADICQHESSVLCGKPTWCGNDHRNVSREVHRK